MPENQRAYKSEKTWRDAILRAVNRRDDGKGSPKRLEVIADKCAQMAIAGEAWAVREIGDRLDGKPAQAIIGDPERPLLALDALDVLELARRTVYLLDLAQREPKRLEVLDVDAEPVGQGKSST